jgi:hypothetical protein
MKSFRLLLLLPLFLAFGCGDEWLQVSFDYPFEGEISFREKLNADQVYSFDSEDIPLDLLRELESRDLASVASARLKSLRLTLPEASGLDWDFLRSAEVSLIAGGAEVSLASLAEAPLGLRELELSVRAEGVPLARLLEQEAAQVRVRLHTREALDADLEILAEAVSEIKASAFK